MPMSDEMYERTRDKILGRTSDGESTLPPLEPIEQWGARQCKVHAEIIKTQERAIDTLNGLVKMQDERIQKLHQELATLRGRQS